MRPIDHNRGVPGPHRLHRQIKAVSVIKVKRNRDIHAIGGSLDVGVIGVQPRIFDGRGRRLQHNRRVQLLRRCNNRQNHFHIFHIKGSHRVAPRLRAQEHLLRGYQRHNP